MAQPIQLLFKPSHVQQLRCFQLLLHIYCDPDSPENPTLFPSLRAIWTLRHVACERSLGVHLKESTIAQNEHHDNTHILRETSSSPFWCRENMAMEMFQLGSRSLNHSSTDTEAEYDRLRDLARQEAAKRSSCFDRAHQAYSSGDGARAHELSEEGKQHAQKMEQYNRQARDYIFRENNADSRVAGDTIDLHGLFVEEAEDVLEERIKAARQRGETHLHVIVGKGNHSKNHVQKIKPRVEQVCRELGLQYRTEENEGRIFVNLQGGAVNEMPPPPHAPSYGGYPGGQQHGGQHHGGQQHGGQQYGGGQQHGGQQQNQNDEIEQMVKKGLPKLLKMLKCCTVM